MWALDRGDRARLRRVLTSLTSNTPEAVAASASEIAQTVRPYAVDDQRRLSVELARRLLTEVARIADSAFEDLEAALRSGDEGPAAGLIETMNRALARHLNFTRWWRQDREFLLRIAPRDDEIVFTIRDRTEPTTHLASGAGALRSFSGITSNCLRTIASSGAKFF